MDTASYSGWVQLVSRSMIFQFLVFPRLSVTHWTRGPGWSQGTGDTWHYHYFVFIRDNNALGIIGARCGNTSSIAKTLKGHQDLSICCRSGTGVAQLSCWFAFGFRFTLEFVNLKIRVLLAATATKRQVASSLVSLDTPNHQRVEAQSFDCQLIVRYQQQQVVPQTV